ncbi:pre-rRNA-processing protein ESF2-like [Phragmites australis]|uniref:pre-rRNA-processing protein ESF2-like n=1 Tax=Phragmites australis TaxID=29695 RepID=UPI002D77CD11|nr:pre-rRNA-processing protein ESF2-like [Phragmites australis]
MAEPTERDRFTDEEGEDNFLEEEQDEQGSLGSDGVEDGGLGGGKRKRPGKSLVGGFGKRGVCYLSRIPPHMNPSHIRQMLSKYGEVLRIYLVPEGQGHRKHTTVKAKAYSEGWIEFAKKSVAKRVANLLNGEQIGGKKRSSFYYDIWNIKYLRKFKWDDLVGEMAEKTHIREQKLTLEIAAAKKQRDHYLSNVEKSRVLKHIQDRRKKKQKTEGTEPGNVLEAKTARPIPQKKPVGETAAKTKSKLSTDILAGVFGSSS